MFHFSNGQRHDPFLLVNENILSLILEADAEDLVRELLDETTRIR